MVAMEAPEIPRVHELAILTALDTRKKLGDHRHVVGAGSCIGDMVVKYHNDVTRCGGRPRLSYHPRRVELIDEVTGGRLRCAVCSSDSHETLKSNTLAFESSTIEIR